jgi:natural product precursor
MTTNQKTKKLVLNKTTLRNLSSEDLKAVAGGYVTQFTCRPYHCTLYCPQ